MTGFFLLDKGVNAFLEERNRLPCGHKGLSKCARCKLGCNLVLEDEDEGKILCHLNNSFELFEGLNKIDFVSCDNY